MTALQFRTMEQCEEARSEMLSLIKGAPTETPAAFVAAACVRPAKLEGA